MRWLILSSSTLSLLIIAACSGGGVPETSASAGSSGVGGGATGTSGAGNPVPNPAPPTETPDLIDLGAYDVAYGVHVFTDGGAVVWGGTYEPVGGSTRSSFLIKLDSSNARDMSFGQGGLIKLEGEDVGLHSVAFDAQGRVIVASQPKTADAQPRLRRYSVAGKPDTTFGEAGIATTKGIVIAVDGSGRIVVAGSNGLARFTEAGVADPSFTISSEASSDKPVQVLLDGDKLVEVSDGESILARFLSDGKPDLTFGDQGKVKQNPGDEIQGGVIADDGAIVLIGANAKGQSFLHPIAYRYLSDGKRDTVFGNAGDIYSESAGQFVAAALGQGGRILLLENNAFSMWGRAYNSRTGQADTSAFSGTGSVSLANTAAVGPRTDLRAWSASGNRVIAVGGTGNATQTSDVAVVRLNL